MFLHDLTSESTESDTAFEPSARAQLLERIKQDFAMAPRNAHTRAKQRWRLPVFTQFKLFITDAVRETLKPVIVLPFF